MFQMLADSPFKHQADNRELQIYTMMIIKMKKEIIIINFPDFLKEKFAVRFYLILRFCFYFVSFFIIVALE